MKPETVELNKLKLFILDGCANEYVQTYIKLEQLPKFDKRTTYIYKETALHRIQPGDDSLWQYTMDANLFRISVSTRPMKRQGARRGTHERIPPSHPPPSARRQASPHHRHQRDSSIRLVCPAPFFSLLSFFFFFIYISHPFRAPNSRVVRSGLSWSRPTNWHVLDFIDLGYIVRGEWVAEFGGYRCKASLNYGSVLIEDDIFSDSCCLPPQFSPNNCFK